MARVDQKVKGKGRHPEKKRLAKQQAERDRIRKARDRYGRQVRGISQDASIRD